MHQILVGNIAIKEARALHQTLSAFAKEVFNSRVNAFVDNSNLISFWNNGGGKSVTLSEEIKDLFSLTLKLNINLSMTYVPSKPNVADSPSRFYSDTDCSLLQFAWSLVDSAFGPHTFDLMAIPSNVMKDRHGGNLKFFSPHPVSGSSGIDVFAQLMSPNENYYAFLPFVLIGPLLRFFQSQKLRVTLIVPDISPRKYWWPILESLCIDCLQIGRENDQNILIFPPKKEKSWCSRPLPWDIYAYCLLF